MNRPPVDDRDPPPTLEEQYERASTTSDLGLPLGPGAGAQGILAAAAWSDLHLGGVLWRLRAQWEQARPHRRPPRTVQTLRSIGLPRDQAKRQHNRERVQFALSYHREKLALKLRIPEYHQVLDQLIAQAVRLEIEEPDTIALAVLDRWLDEPENAPRNVEGARLWECLTAALGRARASLQQGVRGHTQHERVED